MIPITKPFLPPKEEYQNYLDEIWERNWLTNNGPLVNNLELKLKDHLGVDHLLFVTNGTIAIQLAIKALDLKGEIITTPFSYVATTSSIVWENCHPVFVDIKKDTWNLNPDLIEQHITNKTSAILATHVFGNPCDVEELEKLGKKHNLKIIYDGAHAFGSMYDRQSALQHGDITTISFHATKLFHSIEGGAVITRDEKLLKELAYLRNFGHSGPYTFHGLGINGKNSEFHAAMGLVNLNYVDTIIQKRRNDHCLYDKWLEGRGVIKQVISKKTASNFSYYPVLFESEAICLKVAEELENYQIGVRRYFYPLLSSLNYINDPYHLPIAEDIASRILCLPLYFELKSSDIDMICRIILRTLRY